MFLYPSSESLCWLMMYLTVMMLECFGGIHGDCRFFFLEKPCASLIIDSVQLLEEDNAILQLSKDVFDVLEENGKLCRLEH